MSTLSEDLDFFDQNVFDALAQAQGKLTSNSSVDSDENMMEDNEVEEDEETEDSEGEDKWREEEREEEDEGEEEERKTTEKEPSTPKSFSSSLWSEKESTIPRTPDSWDLPTGPVAWDDNDRPIERLLTYAELTLTEEEENGLLTDRIVAACGSYLTESPGNKCHVIAKVLLNNKNLNNIRILGYHRFLQYVDLSWNNLTDLTPLGCLPYLMYLDVSHNLMEEVLRFSPPLNLTYVNYSYNEVWQIDDLTDFWALCYLDLSHNKISKIQGFHNLRYLRYLDLSHNKIERFENLSNLRITDLNLEYNLISRFEMEDGLGMQTMPHLKNVYLNNNLITNLAFLKEVHGLKKLELQGNNICDLVELGNLKRLKTLRHLDMSGNPVSELKPYRNLILNFLQELKFMDQIEVDISERIAAGSKMRFDVQLEAARLHTRMVLLDQLNNTSLDLDVLPVDQGPYPFVILVGPSASSKKYIIDCLAQKYPEKIYVGKLHTTREILNSEKNVLIHLSREEFTEDIKSGKFLCVTENLGHLYGFSKEELGTAVKEHKLCLTAMDIVGALTIHGYGIQPFLVLAIPQSTEQHVERLKEVYGPILSKIGAAYMAQRQLMNTHESNVKRVQTILKDLLDGVFLHVVESKLSLVPDCLSSECMKSMFGGPLATNSEVDEKSQQDSDDMQGIMCYQSDMPCFQSIQTKCGYQAPQDNGSQLPFGQSATSQRFSASETELTGSTTTTSYSATEPAPMKVEISSNGGSSLGEMDPFVNWSMPFIDWSEVNINDMQLEEAAEVLCEKFIQNVMTTRDVYQSVHLDNPGLFSLSIFTDDEEKAIKDITKFLKEVWRSTPNRKPAFDVKKDVIYQAFVPQKLEKLKEMLRNDFLSADGDGTFKGLDDVAPVNSPVSICADLRSKGYGDFVE